MSNTNFKQNTIRKKTALDHRKLNLNTPCPTAPDKTSTLIWGIYANNPRISVYTSDPADNSEKNEYGRIQARLDTPTFFAFLESLERVARSKTEITKKIRNINYVWEDGKRAEESSVVSTLEFGKDKEGLVWIAITAVNRPIIRFPILNSDYHNWCNADDTSFTKAEASEIYALGYCELLRNLVPIVLANEYTDETPKNGNRGYNRPSDSTFQNKPTLTLVNNVSEDIPF